LALGLEAGAGVGGCEGAGFFFGMGETGFMVMLK